jgi:hypothetical protein
VHVHRPRLSDFGRSPDRDRRQPLLAAHGDPVSFPSAATHSDAVGQERSPTEMGTLVRCHADTFAAGLVEVITKFTPPAAHSDADSQPAPSERWKMVV